MSRLADEPKSPPAQARDFAHPILARTLRKAATMRSFVAILIALSGCTTTPQGPSGVSGDRLFEEQSGAWPKLSKVSLCANGRFTIDTAVEVNTDVGTFVQDAPQPDAVTGTASGASREIDHLPITFHYAIAFGDPNVLTAPELTGTWNQLGDAASLDKASAACALVATFQL
jgi:hypothetical protein